MGFQFLRALAVVLGYAIFSSVKYPEHYLRNDQARILFIVGGNEYQARDECWSR